MAQLNEVEEATIANVFYGIFFLVYIMATLPYVKGYHNYRAIIVQSSGLVILSVTMYYRSMKSNTDPAVTYQILYPAVVEVIAIFLSIGVSAICLFYELYMKYIKKPVESIKIQNLSTTHTTNDVATKRNNRIMDTTYDDLPPITIE